MRANVGSIDRALRIIVGITLIVLAATEQIGPWGWLGIIPLLTGVVSFCPAYALLGIRTCKLETQEPNT